MMSPIDGHAEELHKEILGLLYKFAIAPFNDGTLNFPLASIANVLRLDLAQAQQVLNALVTEGLATEPVQHGFQITAHGMQVHESFDGQVIPSFRATGTLTEHAAQTGAELLSASRAVLALYEDGYCQYCVLPGLPHADGCPYGRLAAAVEAAR